MGAVEPVIRVVFDTNTVVSALLFRGALSWLVDHWEDPRVTPLVNQATAGEVLRVLAYPKLGLSPEQADTAAARYLRAAERVSPARTASDLPQCRDADDQKFLQLAVTGKADVLVTGDKDLLDLNGAISPAIETPADYRRRIGGWVA